MNNPATTTLDEICALVSAQLDMLESADPLTPEQLEELHNRAERIRMLCKSMGSEEREETNLTSEEGEETNVTEFPEPSVIRHRIRAKSLAA